MHQAFMSHNDCLAFENACLFAYRNNLGVCFSVSNIDHQLFSLHKTVINNCTWPSRIPGAKVPPCMCSVCLGITACSALPAQTHMSEAAFLFVLVVCTRRAVTQEGAQQAIHNHSYSTHQQASTPSYAVVCHAAHCFKKDRV